MISKMILCHFKNSTEVHHIFIEENHVFIVLIILSIIIIRFIHRLLLFENNIKCSKIFFFLVFFYIRLVYIAIIHDCDSFQTAI